MTLGKWIFRRSSLRNINFDSFYVNYAVLRWIFKRKITFENSYIYAKIDRIYNDIVSLRLAKCKIEVEFSIKKYKV